MNLLANIPIIKKSKLRFIIIMFPIIIVTVVAREDICLMIAIIMADPHSNTKVFRCQKGVIFWILTT